jgi:predicted transcriptional regulator
VNYDTISVALKMLDFNEKESLAIIMVMKRKRLRSSDIARKLGFSYTPKVHPFLKRPQERGYIKEAGRIQNRFPGSISGMGRREIIFSLPFEEEQVIEKMIEELSEKSQKIKKALGVLVEYAKQGK